MRPPPLGTRVLGHPATAGALLLLGGVILFKVWQAGDAILIPVAILGVALSRVIKASEWIAQHRAWQREWDGMAEEAPPRRRDWRPKAAAGLLAITVACFLGDPSNQAAAAGVLFFGSAGVLWVGITLLRQLAKLLPSQHEANDSDGAGIVTIVAKPVMAVPTLANAYSALPGHCRAVLDR